MPEALRHTEYADHLGYRAFVALNSENRWLFKVGKRPHEVIPLMFHDDSAKQKARAQELAHSLMHKLNGSSVGDCTESLSWKYRHK